MGQVLGRLVGVKDVDGNSGKTSTPNATAWPCLRYPKSYSDTDYRLALCPERASVREQPFALPGRPQSVVASKYRSRQLKRSAVSLPQDLLRLCLAGWSLPFDSSNQHVS